MAEDILNAIICMVEEFSAQRTLISVERAIDSYEAIRPRSDKTWMYLNQVIIQIVIKIKQKVVQFIWQATKIKRAKN